MNTSARQRLAYISLAVVAIALGLVVHLHGASLHPDLRDVLGDALWAAMMLWWVSAVTPQASKVKRGTVALAICFAVELSQLIHMPALDAARATTLGRLVLGSGFDLRDLVAYTIGVFTALVIDRGAR